MCDMISSVTYRSRQIHTNIYWQTIDSLANLVSLRANLVLFKFLFHVCIMDTSSYSMCATEDRFYL